MARLFSGNWADRARVLVWLEFLMMKVCKQWKFFIRKYLHVYIYSIYTFTHIIIWIFGVNNHQKKQCSWKYVNWYIIDNKRILLKHLNTLCISFILLYCFGLHIHIQALFSTNVNCLWIYTFCLSIIDKQNNWLHANNTCKHANCYGCYFINEFYQIMNWYNIR